MRLVPHERVTLESPLPPDEFAKRLFLLVEPARWLRWPWDPSERSFEGRVEGRRFQVMRLLKFQRNSSLPVVVGEIVPSDQGSTVRIVLRLHRAKAVFMVLWIGGVLLTGISTQVSRGSMDLDALGFLALAAAGYLFFTVPFRIEVRRALGLLAPLGSVAPASAARLIRT